MSRSVLYASNSTNQTTISTGTVVNFGNIVRRYGQNITMSGGNVVTQGQGYYRIDTNFTITPTAADVITVSLFDNGVLIPGAEVAVSGTASESVAVSIPALVRNACCVEHTITAVVNVGGTVNNASVLVEKV